MIPLIGGGGPVRSWELALAVYLLGGVTWFFWVPPLQESERRAHQVRWLTPVWPLVLGLKALLWVGGWVWVGVLAVAVSFRKAWL